MDSECRDPKSQKKFLIPKVNCSQAEGNRHVLEAESILGKNITSLIEGSATLQEKFKWSSKWSLGAITRILNDDFQQRFFWKKQELKQLFREVRECYAFGLTQSDTEANDICSKGAFAGQILNVPLGNVEQGVNVCQYPDVLLKWAEKKGFKQPCIVIYKILKGRCKTVKARTSIKQPLLDPTPNVDYHISDGIPTPDEPIFSQLSKSQIFLYEYDNDTLPAKHPRHCLPYAVISFRKRNQSPPPPSLTKQVPGNEQFTRCSASTTSKELSTTELDDLNNNSKKLEELAYLSTVCKLAKKSGHWKPTSRNSQINHSRINQLGVESPDGDEKENGARKLPTKENKKQSELPTCPARMKLSDRFSNIGIAPSPSKVDDPKMEALRQEHLKAMEKLEALRNKRFNNSLLGFGTSSEDEQQSFKDEHLKDFTTSAKVEKNGSSNKFEATTNAVSQFPSFEITIRNNDREEILSANIKVEKNTHVSAHHEPEPNSETPMQKSENLQTDQATDESGNFVSSRNEKTKNKKRKRKLQSQVPAHKHGNNFCDETHRFESKRGSYNMKNRGAAGPTRNRYGHFQRRGRMPLQCSEYFERDDRYHIFNMEERYYQDAASHERQTQRTSRVKCPSSYCSWEQDLFPSMQVESNLKERDKGLTRKACRGMCASCNNFKKRPSVPKPQDETSNWKQRDDKRTERFPSMLDSSNNSRNIDSSLLPCQKSVDDTFETSKRQNATCTSPTDVGGHNCDEEPAQNMNLTKTAQSDLVDYKLNQSVSVKPMEPSVEGRCSSDLEMEDRPHIFNIEERHYQDAASHDRQTQRTSRVKCPSYFSSPEQDLVPLMQIRSNIKGRDKGPTQKACRGMCASCNNFQKRPSVLKPQDETSNWKQRDVKKTERISSSLLPSQQTVDDTFETSKRQNATCTFPTDVGGHSCDEEPAQYMNLTEPAQSDLVDHKFDKSVSAKPMEPSVEEICSSVEDASNKKSCEAGKVATSEQPCMEEMSLSGMYEDVSSEESSEIAPCLDDLEVQDMDVDTETSNESSTIKIPQTGGSRVRPSFTLPCHSSSQTNNTPLEHRNVTTEQRQMPVQDTSTPNSESWKTEFPQVSVPDGLVEIFPQDLSDNQNSHACVGPSSVNSYMMDNQANDTESCLQSEQSNWANEECNITSTAQYSQEAQNAFSSMSSATLTSGCWAMESPQESLSGGSASMFPQEPPSYVGPRSAHLCQPNNTQFYGQAHSFPAQSFGQLDSYTLTAQHFQGVPIDFTNLESATTPSCESWSMESPQAYMPSGPAQGFPQEPSHDMQSSHAPLQNNFHANLYTSTAQGSHIGLDESKNLLLATPNSEWCTTELSRVSVSNGLPQSFLQGPSNMQISQAEVRPSTALPCSLSSIDSNTQNYPTSEQTTWIGQQGTCTYTSTAPVPQAVPGAFAETFSGSPNADISPSFLKGPEEGICPPDQPHGVGSDSYMNNPHIRAKALEFLDENDKHQQRVRRSPYNSEDSCTSRISMDEVEAPTKSKEMLFYGRPLLSKAGEKPYEVLFDNITGLTKPVDPRAALSALFGRRFEIELKQVKFSFETPCESVDVKTKKGTIVTHATEKKGVSRRQNTRDPRLLKQQITSDINKETVLTARTALRVISGTDLVMASVHPNQKLSGLDAMQSFQEPNNGNNPDNKVPSLGPNNPAGHQTGHICSSEKPLTSNESFHDALIPSNPSELESNTEIQACADNRTIEIDAPVDLSHYVPVVDVDNHVPDQNSTDLSANIASKVKQLRHGTNNLKPSSSKQNPKPDEASTSSCLLQKIKHVSSLNVGTHPRSARPAKHEKLTGQESKCISDKVESSNESSNDYRCSGASYLNSSHVESQEQHAIIRLSPVKSLNAFCDNSMSGGSSCTSSFSAEIPGYVRLSPHKTLSSLVEEGRSANQESTTYESNQLSQGSRLSTRRWTYPSKSRSPNRSRSSSPHRRSRSPCKKSRSPHRMSRSPCRNIRSHNRSGTPYRERSPYQRNGSLLRRRSRSPIRRSRSQYRRSRSPNRRSRSPNRSTGRSQYRRSRSPSRCRLQHRRSRSPNRRSRSPNRSRLQHRRSRSPSRRTRSPNRTSRSCNRRSRSQNRKSRSPCGRTGSPCRRGRSPCGRSTSTDRSGSSHSRSGSPYLGGRGRSALNPRSRSPHPRSGSPYSRSRSPYPTSGSPFKEIKSDEQDQSTSDVGIHQGNGHLQKKFPEMLRLNDMKAKVDSVRSIVHVDGRHFSPFCKNIIPCVRKYDALWHETNETLKLVFEKSKMAMHDDRKSLELVIESYEVFAADIHLQLESLRTHFDEGDLKKVGIQNMDSRPVSGVLGLTERGQLKVLQHLREMYLLKLDVSDLIHLVDQKINTLQLTLGGVHTERLSSRYYPEENRLETPGSQGLPIQTSIPHQGPPVMLTTARSSDVVTVQSEAAENCSVQTEKLQDIRRVVLRNLGTEVHASHHGNRQGYRASNSTSQNADFQQRNI